MGQYQESAKTRFTIQSNPHHAIQRADIPAEEYLRAVSPRGKHLLRHPYRSQLGARDQRYLENRKRESHAAPPHGCGYLQVAFIPLTVILTITAVKDLVEDLKRWRSDVHINKQLTQVYDK